MLATLVLVHALVSGVDRPVHTLTVVHDPLPQMRMSMSMPTYEPDARDLAVRVGDRVTMRCDLSRAPWICSDVRRDTAARPAVPARAAAAAAPGSLLGLPR